MQRIVTTLYSLLTRLKRLLQWYVLWRCAKMHPSQWRLQLCYLHGWIWTHAHPSYTHPSYNRVTWGLGAMLQKLSVQKWMLQWYVLWRCAQMHPSQWRLQPLHLHGRMSKVGIISILGFLHVDLLFMNYS